MLHCPFHSMGNCRLFRGFRQAPIIAAVCFLVSPLAPAQPAEGTPPSLAAARSLRDRGRFDESVREYCRVLSGYGETRAARLELEQVLRDRFPSWIEIDWYNALPLGWSKEIETVGDDAAERPAAIIAQPANYMPIRSARDPATGAAYSSSAYLYAKDGAQYSLALSVFAQSAAMARTAAEKASWILCAGQRSGLLGPVRGLRLWISDGDAPSGVTVDRDIRVTCGESTLSSFGFYRVIAHEMGHALLPRVCGFSDPEPCAEGYLGEVLLLDDAAAFRAESQEARSELFGEAQQRAAELVREFSQRVSDDLPGDMRGVRILAGAALSLLRQAGAERVASAWRQKKRVDGKDLLGAFLNELSEARGEPVSLLGV
jgi:hypothetical protein